MFQTNFIESCWTVSDADRVLSEDEMLKNVKKSEELLAKAELGRKSHKAKLKNYKILGKHLLVKFLKTIGIKNFIRQIYQWFKG